jgi:cyclohexanecarboxyl-CoA dehydrogenase
MTATYLDATPELEQIAAVAHKVGAELRPHYVDRDRDEFAWDIPHILGRAGLLGLNVSEQDGGQGAGELVAGVVCEILGRADTLAPSILIQAGTVTKLLRGYADPGLADEWVPGILSGETVVSLAFTEEQSGSDMSNVTTRATKVSGGWRINGQKQSVSQAGSQAMVLLASTEAGPLMLLVPAAAEGVERIRMSSLGRRSSGRNIVHLDDVFIPDRNVIGTPNEGVRRALRALSVSRLLVCMSLVGTARGALEETKEWVASRVTFGQPLNTRQGVAFPLVDAYTDVELGELLCIKGLRLADAGKDYRLESAMAKAWVPRKMTDVCRECLILQGHAGYTFESPIQLRMRDILGAELGEGPANTQRLLMSRILLGSNPS